VKLVPASNTSWSLITIEKPKTISANTKIAARVARITSRSLPRNIDRNSVPSAKSCALVVDRHAASRPISDKPPSQGARSFNSAPDWNCGVVAPA